jgi:peptidoglycan/xylan/chitin deacetylase (PgdA/CDA1 family)
MGIRPEFLRAGLKALHFTGAGALLAPVTRGIGVVLTLHHVRPESPPEFSPNRILSITPDFLDRVLQHLLAAGYDIVRLDDLPDRIEQGRGSRPFACFTFDDGYRDNVEHALPVFERYGLPMAIYIATELADGRGDLWWLALEEAIRRLDRVEIVMDGAVRSWEARTIEEKNTAFAAVYWWLRALPEPEARAEVAKLCVAAGYDASGLCGSLVMGWDELRQLACHPLVTLGGHTLGHWALAKLPEEEARRQIVESVVRLEAETGQPCRHFSFPYGDAGSAGPREWALAKEAGLRTAVTTEKSLIHTRHRNSLTGLPRLSLNGNFQDLDHVRTLLTGLPFALLETAKRWRPGRPALNPEVSAASTR